ncbi:MAG TPA: outer membrane protein transport protein [Casimicrobiaceae bacterium]|nr:outer membrane protein transport protein [Casimicrobiaceae bacterium]
MKKKQVAQAIAAAVLALAAGQALGAAFALQEQDGSGLGNAFAGGAAAAEDASTVWSNPAGMSRFSTVQVAGAVSGIFLSAKFNDSGSLPAFNQPLGGDGGQGGQSAAVPSFYLVVPINRDWAFGLGVGVPFGLETDWDSGWLGRYQALHSKVQTLNINPAISWRVNDQFTLAAGVDYQQIKADFTSNVNYSGALATAAQTAAAQGLIPASVVGPFIQATPGLDSSADISGNDWAWGWNVGVMWNITPDTRIGAQYRSSIKYDVNGNINIGNPTVSLPPSLAPIGAALVPVVNSQLASGGVTASIKLPSISNISIYSRLNPKWDVMGDVQYTNWSTIQQLAFVRTGPGATLPPTPENFSNVWRVSGGASYYLDDAWKFRGGIAWDESPVQDAYRTPRLPDQNRFWLAGGVQYTYMKQWKFDLGATYIWVSNGSSNQNEGNTAANGLIQGNYSSNVFVVGGQVSYSF